MDNNINDYCNNIVNTFVKKYSDDIDNHINQMLRYVGFKGTKDGVEKFLEENEYKLLYDVDESNGYSVKVIYLVKDGMIKSYFAIKISTDDSLEYEISDVYVNDVE